MAYAISNSFSAVNLRVFRCTLLVWMARTARVCRVAALSVPSCDHLHAPRLPTNAPWRWFRLFSHRLYILTHTDGRNNATRCLTNVDTVVRRFAGTVIFCYMLDLHAGLHSASFTFPHHLPADLFRLAFAVLPQPAVGRSGRINVLRRFAPRAPLYLWLNNVCHRSHLPYRAFLLPYLLSPYTPSPLPPHRTYHACCTAPPPPPPCLPTTTPLPSLPYSGLCTKRSNLSVIKAGSDAYKTHFIVRTRLLQNNTACRARLPRASTACCAVKIRCWALDSVRRTVDGRRTYHALRALPLERRCIRCNPSPDWTDGIRRLDVGCVLRSSSRSALTHSTLPRAAREFPGHSSLLPFTAYSNVVPYR